MSAGEIIIAAAPAVMLLITAAVACGAACRGRARGAAFDAHARQALDIVSGPDNAAGRETRRIRQRRGGVS